MDALINTVLVGIRQKAIEVAISFTSGAYQTSLISYFTHRDLFPSLMKVRPPHHLPNVKSFWNKKYSVYAVKIILGHRLHFTCCLNFL